MALHNIALFSDKYQRNTFLGVDQKYSNGGSVEHWIVPSKFLEDVVSTSDEKKAPPYMERLQREHCMCAEIDIWAEKNCQMKNHKFVLNT